MNCSSQLSSLKRTAKENFVRQRDTQTTFLLSFGLIFQGLWLAVSFTGFQTHQEPHHKRPCTVMPGDAFAHLTFGRFMLPNFSPRGPRGPPVVSRFQQVIHQVDDLLNQIEKVGLLVPFKMNFMHIKMLVKTTERTWMTTDHITIRKDPTRRSKLRWQAVWNL